MQKGFFDSTDIVVKGDERLRKIPLSVKRPTFENVMGVYNVMMSCVVRDMTGGEITLVDHVASLSLENERFVGREINDRGNYAEGSTATIEEEEEEDVDKKVPASRAFTPLTPLHEAAAASELPTLLTLLENIAIAEEEGGEEEDYLDIINSRAGEKEMTPLHYAAAATTT
eukprot:14686399-Ditylum_brightwellii.AAC.1